MIKSRFNAILAMYSVYQLHMLTDQRVRKYATAVGGVSDVSVVPSGILGKDRRNFNISIEQGIFEPLTDYRLAELDEESILISNCIALGKKSNSKAILAAKALPAWASHTAKATSDGIDA